MQAEIQRRADREKTARERRKREIENEKREKEMSKKEAEELQSKIDRKKALEQYDREQEMSRLEKLKEKARQRGACSSATAEQTTALPRRGGCHPAGRARAVLTDRPLAAPGCPQRWSGATRS